MDQKTLKRLRAALNIAENNGDDTAYVDIHDLRRAVRALAQDRKED